MSHHLIKSINERQLVLVKSLHQVGAIMSKVSEAVDTLNKNLTSIQESIIAQDADIAKLQALNLTTAGGGGVLNAADQALLDGIVKRSADLAKLAKDDLAARGLDNPHADPVVTVVATPATQDGMTVPRVSVDPTHAADVSTAAPAAAPAAPAAPAASPHPNDLANIPTAVIATQNVPEPPTPRTSTPAGSSTSSKAASVPPPAIVPPAEPTKPAA